VATPLKDRPPLARYLSEEMSRYERSTSELAKAAGVAPQVVEFHRNFGTSESEVDYLIYHLRRMGYPPKFKYEDKAVWQCRVPRPIKEALKEHCEEHGLTLSEAVTSIWKAFRRRIS